MRRQISWRHREHNGPLGIVVLKRGMFRATALPPEVFHQLFDSRLQVSDVIHFAGLDKTRSVSELSQGRYRVVAFVAGATIRIHSWGSPSPACVGLRQ